VRYYRACLADGRYERPDVREALESSLAIILGGGYPIRERSISREVRAAVFERAGGRCEECGAPGTEIDHIHGSSGDLANLQLLCHECHHEKTASHFVKITPDSHPEAWTKREELQKRVFAPEPVHMCDRPDWKTVWRSVQRERRMIVQDL